MTLGLDLGVVYELVGPSGARAVFNDSADADFVGYLSNVTGLDSPDVRESADVVTEGDGGLHGDFFYGRRPFVLDGLVWPDSAVQRNTRIDKLRLASDAMRADATLKWTPTGGAAVQIAGRRQAPLRISNDNRLKRFQAGLVAADPRIYSQQLHSQVLTISAVQSGGMVSPMVSPLGSGQSVGGSMVVTNDGTAPTPPLLTILGPVTNPTIRSEGSALNFAYDLAAGETLVVDAANHTVMLNGVTSRYAALIFETSTWFNLEPGDNLVRLEGSVVSTSATLTVAWRDAWL